MTAIATPPPTSDGERGSMAIEFAIVLPVFLLILFGVIGFGMYSHIAITLQHVAAEAARASVGGLTDTERAELATAAVPQTLSASATFLATDDIQLTLGTVTSNGVDYYQVTAGYNLRKLGIAPLLNFISVDPTSLVQRSAGVRYGGT